MKKIRFIISVKCDIIKKLAKLTRFAQLTMTRYEISLETKYRVKNIVFSRASGVLKAEINLESFMRFLEIKEK